MGVLTTNHKKTKSTTTILSTTVNYLLMKTTDNNRQYKLKFQSNQYSLTARAKVIKQFLRLRLCLEEIMLERRIL
jgi:uncharacterized protein YpmS